MRQLLARRAASVPFGDLLMDLTVCLVAGGQWLVLPARCFACGRPSQAVRRVGGAYGCLTCTSREGNR